MHTHTHTHTHTPSTPTRASAPLSARRDNARARGCASPPPAPVPTNPSNPLAMAIALRARRRQPASSQRGRVSRMANHEPTNQSINHSIHRIMAPTHTVGQGAAPLRPFQDNISQQATGRGSEPQTLGPPRPKNSITATMQQPAGKQAAASSRGALGAPAALGRGPARATTAILLPLLFPTTTFAARTAPRREGRGVARHGTAKAFRPQPAAALSLVAHAPRLGIGERRTESRQPTRSRLAPSLLEPARRTPRSTFDVCARSLAPSPAISTDDFDDLILSSFLIRVGFCDCECLSYVRVGMIDLV
jgi:hypothetical protein